LNIMVRIILIRPGSTDYDQQGRIQGNLDVPLNEQGQIEAKRLADELRERGIEVVYTSPDRSARQTAEALAQVLDVRCKTLDQMQNLDFGLWQGMAIEEVRVRQPKVYRQWQEKPENVCPPNGEMLGQAEARAGAVLGRLLKRHKQGTIAMVVPEPMASVVRHCAGHTQLGDLWRACSEHGRWESMDVEPASLVPSR
jgi:broad specificity phosphatase PhoE